MFDYAVHKAREMAADYALYVLGGNSSRKCEKEFLWRCQESLNLAIKIRYMPVTLPTHVMHGTYIRKKDGFDIILKPNLPPDWERFVLVKEIFHALLDGEAFHNPNVMEHLEKTLFGEIPAGGTVPLHVLSEYATQGAAAEFLFPWQDRKKIIDDARTGEIADIARSFDVPVTIVEHFLMPSAMKFYEFP